MKRLLIPAALSLLMITPALAEQRDKRTGSSVKHSQSYRQQDDERARMQQRDQQRQQRIGQQDIQRNITGEVVDLRNVNLRGEREQHVLAKVRLTEGRQEGKMVVLDLGPQSSLQEEGVLLKKRDRIEAQGVQGRINDMPVLVVTGFSPDSQQQRSQQRSQQRNR